MIHTNLIEHLLIKSKQNVRYKKQEYWITIFIGWNGWWKYLSYLLLFFIRKSRPIGTQNFDALQMEYKKGSPFTKKRKKNVVNIDSHVSFFSPLFFIIWKFVSMNLYGYVIKTHWNKKKCQERVELVQIGFR